SKLSLTHGSRNCERNHMLKSRGKPSRRIAITMGDACGVGPEVTVAAIEKCRALTGVDFLVIGNETVLDRFWKRKFNRPDVIHVESKAGHPHISGKPTPVSGRDSLTYLEYAVKLLKDRTVHALVTAPVAKEAIIPFYPGFKGHTTYLAEAFSLDNVQMLFVAGSQRVVLVTRHVPLKDVPGLVTSSKIVSVVNATTAFVAAHFGIKDPRVAVCGLNPHAGEGGHIGDEEIHEIIPALVKLRRAGLNISGPLPADTLFEPRLSRQYDLIAAMYHDQALTALKAQSFNCLVNVTVGLPFIRTSPAHGTAFGIAGKGLADPGSMVAAIKLAAELS
ncbi:MAG: 4-hydroxythreonine-4-phosphate dehydrogenase PdxA, partial [Candidatus Omnitrophota bacterium]